MLFSDRLPDIEISRKPVRRLRLTVTQEGAVRCSVPHGVPDMAVRAFINAHAGWITDTLEKMRLRREQHYSLRYSDGEKHLLQGRLLPLRVEEERGRESAAFYDDEIVLYCHPDNSVQQRKKVLYKGYYLVFKPTLDALVEKWLVLLGVPPLTISVRLMKTEWGSCSPKKHRMTFNVDLARLPADCVEYVVIHEFTHLDHANHSGAFWALCEQRLASAGLADSKTMRRRMREIIRAAERCNDTLLSVEKTQR